MTTDRVPRRTTVAVLEEYIPQYRVPFFRELKARGAARDLEILICAGTPNETQTARGDAAPEAIDLPIRQREFGLLGRRVVLRRLPRRAKSAALIISSQARRNLDLYRWLIRPRALRRRKVAVWGHGVDHVEVKSRFDAWLLSLIARRADWLFVYTKAGAEAVAPWTRRVTVFNNSTDTGALTRDLESITASTRAAYADTWRLGPNVALFVGGLDHSKRLDELLDACGGAAQRLDDFQLLVAGAGLLADELEAACAGRPWLRLVGHVTGVELALAFDAAGLIVMPGRVGLVAVDALTAGLPVLTLSDSHHAPEFAYLENGSTAVVCDSVRELSAAIVDLFSDDQRLDQMSAACRSAAGDFSIDTMAANFLEGIVTVLEQA